MKILYSMDLKNPTGKGGVAVILNKNLINSYNSDFIKIIPGRVMLVSVNWHKEECIKILCIYALTSLSLTEMIARLFRQTYANTL